MYYIRPLRKDIVAYVKSRGLNRKWDKSRELFLENPRHPSLHTEILEPKENLVYSFRIDHQYRALFLVHNDKSIEIIKITNHYQ